MPLCKSGAGPTVVSADMTSDLHHVNRDEWVGLAATFADHNYRQLWDYAAAMAKRSNADAEHVAVTRGERTLGLASVRVKRLRAASTGIAYVSGGPLVRAAGVDDAREALTLTLDALKREYVSRRRLVLRVAPAPGDAAWNAIQAECFAAAGFTAPETLAPYRTILVDIDRPLAEVRARFAQKWRNHLNKSERQDLQVAERWDDSLSAEFASLFDELVARKSFAAPLGPDFYAQVQQRLPEHERLYVAIASVGDEPAAGVVVAIHGDTGVYVLGASNDAGRKSNAAYLLQWKAIEAAAARGCRLYDLGGVDAQENPGVYKFKSGMGGEELLMPGPYEIAGGRLRWTAVRASERAFRVVSNVRARV
jgi:hypothetical protein